MSLLNTDKTITWEDVRDLPPVRATCIYKGKIVGIEKWHAGLTFYDGVSTVRGAYMPYAEYGNESQVFGADGVGLLACTSTTDKAYFCAEADYLDTTVEFTECTFAGGALSTGTIDNMFVDCGEITDVGRVLLLFEYKDETSRNIWYSTDNNAYQTGDANIGVKWDLLVFADTMSYYALRHFHGGQWFKDLGSNDGTLLIMTGDNDGGCAMLLCDDVKSLLDTPDTWFDRWGWGEVANQTFTADAGADTITLAADIISDDDVVFLKTTNTLPAPLSASDTYYIYNSSGATTQLVDERGSTTPIDITDTGTGTHTLYTTDRKGWIDDPTDTGVTGTYPDEDYVIGWNSQLFRAVGTAYDAKKQKIYWMPDSGNVDYVSIRSADLSVAAHTVTDIVAPSGGVKGFGWTGIQTENGSVVLASGSSFSAIGVLDSGSDEYLNIYGITADGLHAKLLKRYKRGDSDIAKGRWPTGGVDNTTPANLLSYNGNVYIGGYVQVALHSETNGLESIRHGFSPVGGTVKTFNNLLDYGDFGTWTQPAALDILEITDYSGTVAGTTRVKVDTIQRIYDNNWITIAGVGWLDGEYQVKRIDNDEVYLYKAFESGGSLGTVQLDPFPAWMYATTGKGPSAPWDCRYSEATSIPSTSMSYAGKSLKFVVDASSAVNGSAASLYYHRFTETEMKYLRGKTVTAIVWVNFAGPYTETNEATTNMVLYINRIATAHNAANTYALGDKVAYGSGVTRRIYEALEEIVPGEADDPSAAPAKWQDNGPQRYLSSNTVSRHSANDTDNAIGTWLPLAVTIDIPLDAASDDQTSYYCNLQVNPCTSTSVTTATTYIANLGVYEGVLTEVDMFATYKVIGSRLRNRYNPAQVERAIL